LTSLTFYLPLRFVTGMSSRAPNFRNSTTSSPLSIRSLLGDYACQEEGNIAPPPLPPTRIMRDWWCCTCTYSFIAILSLSLSLSLSFFLSFFLSIFTRSLSRVTLRPNRLSSWSNGPSYQMYISVAILDFAPRRMSRRERFSGPTGTDWTPAKRQPGRRPSCSCARYRGRGTRHWVPSRDRYFKMDRRSDR